MPLLLLALPVSALCLLGLWVPRMTIKQLATTLWNRDRHPVAAMKPSIATALALGGPYMLGLGIGNRGTFDATTLALCLILGLPGVVFGWYVVIRHLSRTRPAAAARPDNA
ncbi:hypothetical protein BI335_19705 [Enemella evansiae]|nr:hypothetical protein BI335_19705 [Enemella evansiae]